MGKYVLFFGSQYLGWTLVVLSAQFLFDVDLKASYIVAAIAAATMTSMYFVKDEQRIPDKPERRVLAWSSLLLAWLIGVGTDLLFLWLLEGMDLIALVWQQRTPLLLGMFAAGVLFVSLVYLLIFHVCYGWFAKRALAGAEKKLH